jgi:hypothetical protein
MTRICLFAVQRSNFFACTVLARYLKAHGISAHLLRGTQPCNYIRRSPHGDHSSQTSASYNPGTAPTKLRQINSNTFHFEVPKTVLLGFELLPHTRR